ncbi:hypothetical protein LSP03_35130 [Lysinibacillus sphaericus]|nr:hypothetical protein LSP03_35130 [Lysinibacillus sphaericus]
MWNTGEDLRNKSKMPPFLYIFLIFYTTLLSFFDRMISKITVLNNDFTNGFVKANFDR